MGESCWTEGCKLFTKAPTDWLQGQASGSFSDFRQKGRSSSREKPREVFQKEEDEGRKRECSEYEQQEAQRESRAAEQVGRGGFLARLGLEPPRATSLIFCRRRRAVNASCIALEILL